MSQENKKVTTETTGHVWDEDLQELNNPLPRWWIWGFYATLTFALVYWMLYPAWPLFSSYTKGISNLNTVTYTATTVDGKQVEKTTHWNMRAKLMVEMNQLRAEQKPYFDKVAATPFAEVAKNEELMQFVNSAGKTLFTDNCAPCHQAGGQGKIKFAPNLTDDYWQYGGSYEDIQTTITAGRHGVMPAFKAVLTEPELTQVANYVLSLSGEPHDALAAKAGDAIFHGKAGCVACHGADAKGMTAIGSANLTDKIWLWADVVGAKTPEAKLDEVKTLVRNGMDKGVMPVWGSRLSPEQIKLLTVYVHDGLGGGK
jgi:cytochrome c oxidase cbb3-type subunit III